MISKSIGFLLILLGTPTFAYEPKSTSKSQHSTHMNPHHDHHSNPLQPPPLSQDIPPPATTSSIPKCSIDLLKLDLCLDVLGGLVHIGIGDPVRNTCCPVIDGLLELEAAVCLCTAIKLKVLNLNIFIPLALNVLLSCGKNPPPGYVCPGP